MLPYVCAFLAGMLAMLLLLMVAALCTGTKSTPALTRDVNTIAAKVDEIWRLSRHLGSITKISIVDKDECD